MADLPLHEAVAALLRHWGDPTFVPPNVYELNLGHVNQLFYFLIAPLAFVVPIRHAATKIVVFGTLLFLPVSVARLADYLGVTRWVAVLIAPVGLGWLFFWGLLANLIALDLFFVALPTIDRFCHKRPLAGRGRLSSACGLARDSINLAHGSCWSRLNGRRRDQVSSRSSRGGDGERMSSGASPPAACLALVTRDAHPCPRDRQ